MKRQPVHKKCNLCFVMPGTYQLFNKSMVKIHGGAELNLYYLSRIFAADDRFQVTFITESQQNAKKEVYDGVCVIPLDGIQHQSGRGVIGGIKKELVIAGAMLFSDYDVIICSTASLLLTRAVFWSKFKRRRKVIFRFANDTDANPHYFHQTGGSALKDRLYWWGVRHADQLIFQTKQQMAIFNQVEKRKGTIISNGFHLKQEMVAEKQSVLWISRADPVKRPELLLELAKRLPKEKFIMIMPGKNELSSKIIAEINAHYPNVQYIEYVDYDKIMAYYKDAKLFVNTSTYEGFPNSFIQAAMAQTPILSFVINPDQILTKYDFGFVCGDSLDQAETFIVGLSQSEIERMGTNGWNYVEENHDIRQTKKKYMDLINKIAYGFQGMQKYENIKHK